MKIWTEEEIETKAVESVHFCPKCNGPLYDLLFVRITEKKEARVTCYLSALCPICGILRTRVEYLPKFCGNCASQYFGTKIAEPGEEFCWFCGGKMELWKEKEVRKKLRMILAAKKLEKRVEELIQLLSIKRKWCVNGKSHVVSLENATLLSPPFFTLTCEKCKKVFTCYSDSFEG